MTYDDLSMKSRLQLSKYLRCYLVWIAILDNSWILELMEISN